MNHTFANYHNERAAFRDLFADACDKRILLFKGASGCGKSSLLKACLNDKTEGMNTVAIELRESRVGVEEILSRSALSIGKGKLPRYSQCAQELVAHKPQIQLKDITQVGGSNSLSVALNIQNLRESEQRHATLTEAWFEDMKELDTPLVMAFDTYEQAAIEVQNWLSGPFLTRTAFCDTVRVAIAGQKVPEPGIEAWGHYHVLHELYGVREAREWMPVVKALGKLVPAENPLDWMAGTCNALKGKPSEIMEIIKTLPDACSLMPEGIPQ